MFFRILKKDFKRKKTMNVILWLFVILAAMFVASGINNVVTVMNGTDYYLDKAGIGDYVVITMGENCLGALDEVLENKTVADYRMENVVWGEKSNLESLDGKELEAKNSVVYQSIENSKLHFFDADDQLITDLAPGHAYATGRFMEKNGLKAGDRIRITCNSVSFTVILDGKAKDALLGSDMMGNTRFLLSGQEIDKLLADETIRTYSQGQICYIDTVDEAGVSELSSVLSDASNIAFDGSRATIKMCYVMDMIVAFVILILSICLILVAFVVLKFSITFTIEEEFREIGVMKAIGIGNFKIRSLYLVKYLMLAVTGAAMGFVASIPFSKLLLKSVSSNMVLGNDNSMALSLAGAFIVVVIILLFAFRCTKVVKKSSPIDAIRSGQTGERYQKKSALRITKSHGSTSFFLAANDVLSAPKRFATIIIAFFVCTLFVLILVNTTATMRSDSLVTTFGTRSDLYFTDLTVSMDSMNSHGGEIVEKYLKQKEELFKTHGMPCSLCVEAQYKYKVTVKGNPYILTCQQGIHTKASDYEYIKGLAPEKKNEIAITPAIAKLTGAKLGDVVTIDFGTEKMNCIVVGYFQSMNQLGEIIRLHEDAPTDFSNISSILSYQINFSDHPSPEVIEQRKEKIKQLLGIQEVMNAAEYCDDCMGVADTMEAVQFLLLGITLIVVILVSVLMERSFIADERCQIAILKAIGFGNGKIIKWHVYRFGIVTLFAVVFAAVCSIPMTHLVISPVFAMMGATEVSYVINPLQVFFIYPGIILVMTVLTSAGITIIYSRKIKSRDTANIE